jgi:hypothetical protein
MKSILAVIAGFAVVGSASAQWMTASGSLSASAKAYAVRDYKSGVFGGSITAKAQSGVAYATATASARFVAKLKVEVKAHTTVFVPMFASATAFASATIRIGVPKLMSGVVAVSGGVHIKVGNSGNWTYVARPLQIPVCVGPTGLTVGVRVGALTNTGGGGTVEFLPNTSRVTPYGPKCAAELQGAWFPSKGRDVFCFRTTKAPSTPFNFILFGTKRLSLRLPPSNCLLLTDLPVFIPITIVAGTGELRFAIPRIPGLVFNAQLLGSEKPMPNVYWRTSNALQFKLP